MYPTLFSAGPVEIRSWGVMLFISFILGIWLSQRRCRLQGINPQIVPDLAVVILICAIIGSRINYAVEHPKEFRSFFDFLAIWRGGLTFYGGFILATIGSIAYLKKKKISITLMMDIIAPALALGLCLTRIGCFLNGCCFGKPTKFFLGVKFPPGSIPYFYFPGEKIHPTQLYESAFGLFMFFVLRRLERVNLPRGALFFVFTGGYGVWRFSIDFLRFYEKQVRIGPLVETQIISIIVIIVSIICLRYLYLKRS